jgi:hypothetical protein
MADCWSFPRQSSDRSRRDGSQQATIEPFDLDVEKVAGSCCGLAGTSDVVDATVVIAAHQHRAKIVSWNE